MRTQGAWGGCNKADNVAQSMTREKIAAEMRSDGFERVILVKGLEMDKQQEEDAWRIQLVRLGSTQLEDVKGRTRLNRIQDNTSPSCNDPIRQLALSTD